MWSNAEGLHFQDDMAGGRKRKKAEGGSKTVSGMHALRVKIFIAPASCMQRFIFLAAPAG
jgi:hypothetical protein